MKRRAHPSRWAGVALGAAIVAALLLWQRDGVLDLRSKLALARLDASEAARGRAEIARLAAQQTSAAELERLRSDRDALPKLRAEIEKLRAISNNAGVRPFQAAKLDDRPAGNGSAFASGRNAKAEEWTNAGHATPVAAFETMLWAAAGGDIDALAQTLVFDSRWRAQVDVFWAQVSEATRTQYATPERLFAALTAKDVPIGSALVFHQAALKPGEWGTPSDADYAGMAVRVTDSEKNSKNITFVLRRQDEGWRIVFPGAAIAKYRDTLRGVSAGPTAK